MRQPTGPPYPGPRPYRQADQKLYFGHTGDAALVAERWKHNQLAYLTGPAGRGKTSLLHAGVLPRLAGQGLDILPIGELSRNAAFPIAALPRRNPYTFSLLRSWSPDESVRHIVGEGLLDFIQRRSGSRVIFAAIDHIEDLLAETGVGQARRDWFLAELRETLEREPRLHLLIVGREEAVDLAANALGRGARHDLPALTCQEAMEAIREPLLGSGRSIGVDAAQRMLTDLRTSRIVACDGADHYVTDNWIEPVLLQIACAWLWDSLPPDVTDIATRDVRRYGDVDAALAAYYGKVLAQVADDHDLSMKELLSWLLSSFVTKLGTRGTESEDWTTAGMPNAMARTLVGRHLLVSWVRSRSRWYELLHDRVIEPLRQVVDRRPPPPQPEELLCTAEHALTAGELDMAERYARQVLSASSGADLRLEAQAYSLLGNLVQEREEADREAKALYREAEALYREAAKRYAAAGDAWAVAYQLAAIAQMLLMQEKVDDAVDELQAAVARQPSDPVLQTEFAQALWQNAQGPAAVAVLNNVLRTDGGDLSALRTRGEILAYLGDADQAIRDLNRVNSKGEPSTRAARGLALAKLGDLTAALREIKDAIAEGRRNGPVLLYAARASKLSGDEEKAQELAEQAADATDPPLSPPHREVARKLAGLP